MICQKCQQESETTYTLEVRVRGEWLPATPAIVCVPCFREMKTWERVEEEDLPI